MRSLAEINRQSLEAGIKSAREEKRPLVIEQEDISDRQVLSDVVRRIPDIGSYVPEGWIETERYFVDNSGWSDPEELASHGCLSGEQFLDKIKPGKGYAIVQVGQFQLYVGEFERL